MCKKRKENKIIAVINILFHSSMIGEQKKKEDKTEKNGEKPFRVFFLFFFITTNRNPEKYNIVIYFNFEFSQRNTQNETNNAERNKR